jgi:predicted nucleic acid-binding protein
MAANRRVELHASVEMIQEFVFHRLRMTGDPELAVAQGEALRQFVTLAPFDESVLNAAQGLVRRGHARGRDAVHAATARDRGIDAIVTTDPDFGRVPGLRATAPETLVSTLSDGPA